MNQRRDFMGSAVLATALSMLPKASWGEEEVPPLTEKEGSNLMYAENATKHFQYKPGHECGACRSYRKPGEPRGPCDTVATVVKPRDKTGRPQPRTVSAKGLCLWFKKV